MAGLDFLYSPNSQVYEAGQRMQQDNLMNRGKDLQNQQMEAQLPGIMGNSQSLSAKGQMDQSMMPDRMEAERSKLMAGMSEDQAKMLDEFGSSVGQMGSMLEQVPPVLRTQAMQQMSQKFGLQGKLPDMTHVPQEQLPQVLRSMGENMAMSGRKFMQEKALKAQDNQAHMERQVQAGKDSTKTAQVRANTTLEKTALDNEARTDNIMLQLSNRLQVAEKKANAMEANMREWPRWNQLNRAVADGSASEAQKDEFRNLTKMMTTQRVLGTPQTDDSVMGQDTPMERAQKATDSITGGSGNSPASSGDPDQKTISQAFGSYEPTKYRYRVFNGKVQRTPK